MEILFRYFPGLETWWEGSNQCELMEIASRTIKIGEKLRARRQIESEEVKCLTLQKSFDA
jgi:hypothetical protein